MLTDILHPLLLVILFHLFPLSHNVVNAELPGDLLFHLFRVRQYKADLSVVLLRQILVIFCRLGSRKRLLPERSGLQPLGLPRHFLYNFLRVKDGCVFPHNLFTDRLEFFLI